MKKLCFGAAWRFWLPAEVPLRYLSIVVDRENQFKIRLSAEEVARLEALAENAGLTKTDYVRLLLRREWENSGPKIKKRSK